MRCLFNKYIVPPFFRKSGKCRTYFFKSEKSARRVSRRRRKERSYPSERFGIIAEKNETSGTLRKRGVYAEIGKR